MEETGVPEEKRHTKRPQLGLEPETLKLTLHELKVFFLFIVIPIISQYLFMWFLEFYSDSHNYF